MPLLLLNCATIPPGLTYDNFLRIKKGMTEQQVIKILGEPTDITSVSVDALGIGEIFGISEVSGTNMFWTTDKAKANIIFLQGKVKSSNFTNQF